MWVSSSNENLVELGLENIHKKAKLLAEDKHYFLYVINYKTNLTL